MVCWYFDFLWYIFCTFYCDCKCILGVAATNSMISAVVLYWKTSAQLPNIESTFKLLTKITNILQVSVYSGPLHNDRLLKASDSSSTTLADRLANARMMSKSGYTWDQSGSCAKIRY